MSTAPIRLHAPPPFELWLVALADAAPGADIGLLDEQERERAARFVFERDRRRYVGAHVALRQLLGRRLGRPPGALRFESGAFGKPRLLGGPSCAFSLSHSGDKALVALADGGEIGVDIEARSAPPRDVDALARQCLAESERFLFDATPAAERELSFLRAWTRKEACLKALGTGLQVEPSSFETGLHTSEARVRIDTPGGMAEVLVQSVEPAPGWVGAIAQARPRPKWGISGGGRSLYSHA